MKRIIEKGKGFVIGIIVLGSIMSVSAYNTQLWSPVQYVKKLFVTYDGSSDVENATIKLDGTNGTIYAKNLKINGEDVATKAYVNSHGTSSSVAILNQAKNYADEIAEKKANEVYAKALDSTKQIAKKITKDYLESLKSSGALLGEKTMIADKCYAGTVGLKNKKGNTCLATLVTNYDSCIKGKIDGCRDRNPSDGRYYLRYYRKGREYIIYTSTYMSAYQGAFINGTWSESIYNGLVKKKTWIGQKIVYYWY